MSCTSSSGSISDNSRLFKMIDMILKSSYNKSRINPTFPTFIIRRHDDGSNYIY